MDSTVAPVYRVLMAKVGLDGHDRGARLVARLLRDDGYEVIYTGLRQTVETVLVMAEQEDVDVIGLSVLTGTHLQIVEDLMRERTERDMRDIPVVLGGIVPPGDVPELERLGVDAIISPGASTREILDAMRSVVTRADTSAGL